MSRTYKATGINLKSMPMGESDRLLTILTPEFGLVRAVAMGARKHNSSLSGRSGLFVVNQLLIVKGRSLDKVTQAETLASYPGLSQDLSKLTASQYLAELCLYQALSDQPQEELFCLLNEHLQRLERSPAERVLAHLTHAVFQLLVLAGVAPQVYLCCLTQQEITPDLTDANWRAGFSAPAGGTVTLTALADLKAEKAPKLRSPRPRPSTPAATEAIPRYQSASSAVQTIYQTELIATELYLLQQLSQAQLPTGLFAPASDVNVSQPNAETWRSVERILRHYAQYHFDRSIRSATLIDACFAPTCPS